MKKYLSLILALVMLLSLCACGAKEETQEATEAVSQATESQEAENQEVQETQSGGAVVTDMLGREVTVVPGSYSRVVCIGAGALRMYTYIGDVELLAGVEDIDNISLSERPMMFDSVARPYVLAYGEGFTDLPSCGVGGPMAQAAETEKILACEPDIVISAFEDAAKADALQEQLGVPVITLSTGPKGVFDQQFYDSMTLLGKIFRKDVQAAELLNFIQNQVVEITNRVKDIPQEDKPSVYVCGLGNWGTTDHLMTAESYASFEIAGVKNVLNGLGVQGVAPIEEEKFVELGESMDMIIMDAAAVKNIQPLYAQDNTMFDTCKAWRDGEVYLQMAYNAYYTNYEIALMNTWFIAKTVYPEAFADIDMTAKTNEITRAFLEQELAEEIFSCPSSFGGYQKMETKKFFG